MKNGIFSWGWCILESSWPIHGWAPVSSSLMAIKHGSLQTHTHTVEPRARRRFRYLSWMPRLKENWQHEYELMVNRAASVRLEWGRGSKSGLSCEASRKWVWNHTGWCPEDDPTWPETTARRERAGWRGCGEIRRERLPAAERGVVNCYRWEGVPARQRAIDERRHPRIEDRACLRRFEGPTVFCPTLHLVLPLHIPLPLSANA